MTERTAQGAPADAVRGAAKAKKPRPARVVIVGECNSGKTTLVNTLLGESILPASFVTRTGLPTVVEFGAKPRLALEQRDGSRVATRWEDVDAMDRKAGAFSSG